MSGSNTTEPNTHKKVIWFKFNAERSRKPEKYDVLFTDFRAFGQPVLLHLWVHVSVLASAGLEGGGWELPPPDSDGTLCLATAEGRVEILLGSLASCMQASEAKEIGTNLIAEALFGEEGVRLGRPLGQTQQETSSSSGQSQPVAAVGKRERPAAGSPNNQMSWEHYDEAIAARRSKRLEVIGWAQLVKLDDVNMSEASSE